MASDANMYHIIAGEQILPNASEKLTVATLLDDTSLLVEESNSKYYITANSNARFAVQKVVRLLNGLVYVIDQVLDPTDGKLPATLAGDYTNFATHRYRRFDPNPG